MGGGREGVRERGQTKTETGTEGEREVGGRGGGLKTKRKLLVFDNLL